MAKRLALLLCALFSLWMLSGCSGPGIIFRATDELYSLPRPSSEYTMLQKALQQLLDEGLEYAPPVSGSNTQPVRLSDLDGDDQPEALAFFRDSSADAAPLKIYIFHQNEDGEFEQVCTIGGEGSEINSVTLCQLVGDDSSPQELVISWQMANSSSATSHTVYTLSAFSLSNWEPVELMNPTRYTRYIASDLDQDGERELLLMNVENSDNATSTATYYDRSGLRLDSISTANLSTSISTIDKVKDGLLADGAPVVYVSGSVVDKIGGSSSQITDVLTLKKGTLCNITLNSETLDSDTTLRYAITGGQDINEDGVLEIPHPFVLPSYEQDSADVFYAIDWQQYFSDGSYVAMTTTYYNNADGWYLELPADWENHFSLSRQDVTSGSTNERGIVFYYTDGPKAWSPFLAIYKNIGSNRQERSTSPGRIQLYEDSSMVFSMELLDHSPVLTLSEAGIKKGFHLIVPDWSTD